MTSARVGIPAFRPILSLSLLLAVLAPVPAARAQVAASGRAAEAPLPTTAPPAADRPLEVVRRAAGERGVTVAQLSNGLTVIVGENHNVPVVTVQSFVRAGSMLEGPWLGSGLSHLLEHLVAKGAVHEGNPEQPGAESRSRLDAIGAQSNAYTTLDHTAYYVNTTAGQTDEAIRILADWMARPQINRPDFDREHGVVQRELEMGKDDPDRQLHYAHAANFYGTHPAAVPTIGFRGALEDVTYEDVLEYHRQRYAPQNMLVVVVGDVQTADVIDTVAAAFAGFETAASPDVVLPEVNHLAGVRRVELTNPAVKEVAQRVAFRSIPLVHPDLYALDVLSDILTNGPASRLYRILVREKQLVTGIDSGSWTPEWGAGQFVFSFRAEPGKADAAEAELLAQLRRVAEEGVTEDELARAKRQMVAAFVYGQQSVESQAARLASDFMSTGDVDFSRRYTDRIQAVTAEQVRAMARKYLTLDAMAVTRMSPPSADLAAVAESAGPRADAAETFTLPNGLTVVLGPTDTVDLVSMHMATLGGLMVEDAATNGLGMLMTQLSLKGAGGRSADDIADFFGAAGGEIGAQSGNNTFIWSATVLKDDAPEALQVLADVVIRPTFPAAELEILRPQVLAAIDRIDEQWFSQGNQFFRERFFRDSPYRFSSVGSADVVAGATVEAVAAHHDAYLKAGSSVLSVYGNFDPATMRRAIEQAFADVPEGKTEVAIPAPRTVDDGGETYVLPTTNEQAAIFIGYPGMRLVDEADRDAMTVLDTLISGYDLPRGWLHGELRGEQLVYVVHALNWVGLAPGTFMVYAGTQPDRAQEVVERIERNVRRTLDYGWSAEEIREAVNIVLTSELLDRQTMSSLAMQAALDELYGLGYDYQRTLEPRLRAVTAEDLHRVAQTYLSGPPVVAVTTPQPEQVSGK